MVISRARLKQIIKEEILSEVLGPVDGSGLKTAGDELKNSIAQIASTLDSAGEDVRTGSITAAGQVTSIIKVMQELEKMFRTYEEQTNDRLNKAEQLVKAHDNDLEALANVARAERGRPQQTTDTPPATNQKETVPNET